VRSGKGGYEDEYETEMENPFERARTVPATCLGLKRDRVDKTDAKKPRGRKKSAQTSGPGLRTDNVAAETKRDNWEKKGEGFISGDMKGRRLLD